MDPLSGFFYWVIRAWVKYIRQVYSHMDERADLVGLFSSTYHGSYILLLCRTFTAVLLSLYICGSGNPDSFHFFAFRMKMAGKIIMQL